MIEQVYEDVKTTMGTFIDNLEVVDHFLYLGEEHILQDASPPRIVMVGSSETLHSGGPVQDTYGRSVKPFAQSRVILKLFVFARSYTEVRDLIYGFLQSLDAVRSGNGERPVKKYTILKSECTISYDTWDERRGYRMATCTVPLQNIVMATETTWVRIQDIIHECGIMILDHGEQEDDNGEEG